MNASDIDLAHACALGNQDESEQREIDALLAGPAAARAEFEATVKQTQETLAELSSATSAQPPPELRARLLSQIAAESGHPAESALETSVPAATSLAEHRSRSNRWRLAVGAAAAAALVLIAGMFIGQQLRGSEPPSTVDAVLAATDARTASTMLEGGGSTTVVYSRQADAAIVIVNDVAKPPGDSVFQMWLAEGAANPVSAGIIDQDQFSATTTSVVPDVGAATMLALTVEPPGGSPLPTNPPFMAIPLT